MKSSVIIFLVLVLKIVKCDLDLTKLDITDATLRSHNISLCCPGENMLDTSIKHCRDNDPWEMNCTDGMYLVNPKDSTEGLVVIRDDLHLYQIQKRFNFTVIPSDYCITNFKNDTNAAPVQVVFICLEPYALDTYYTVFIFRGTLAFISVFFLLVTLYVYLILPDLRETQDKFTIFAVICSTVFLFLLALLQVTPGLIPMDSCVIIAYLILFFVLAHFAWLNMVMANVWKITVMRRWKILESRWYILAHLYAWSVPIIVVIFAITGHHSDLFEGPGFGVGSCWFGNRDIAYNYLYIPMSIMLTINLIFFIWTAYVLLKHEPDMSMDRKRALSYRCKLYVALFGISGLSWIFEILSHHFQDLEELEWYWYITDALNTLCGLFIFIILIVWRKRVRKSLAGKHVLCCKLPKSWGSNDSPEEETLQDEDADNPKNEVEGAK